MKTGDKVIIAFLGDENMPWSAYAGPAILVREDPAENWAYDSQPGEIHWEVDLPNGKRGMFFPLSSIYSLGGA